MSPSPNTNDPLLRFRAEFPILEKNVYLISNSLGAMPRGTRDALNEYADLWATRGVRAWEETWWEMASQVGDEIAQLMNALPRTISTHQNVTQCEAIVASCLNFSGKRNKVVYTDMNFPSVMYFWEAQQRARGARVHMVKTDDGITINTQRLLDAIDEETLIVPISHVLFRSAYIKDVRAIVEKAHKVGAMVLLDCFHSVGIVPVDVQALNVDFATGGVLKWLCGGPGTAYLYVRPDHGKRLEPTLTGWAAHEKPFRFETGPTRYNEPPYRFMNGTPNVAALYAARPGLRIIKEAGIDNIRAKSKRQTALLKQLAEDRGWKVNSPPDAEHRGGTITIEMPNSKEVCAELLKRDVVVDWRPNAGVRMAPHFYNTDEELHAAVGVVEEILAGMKVAR
ncbi:MAG TPA: aminotransferase class V-fold PLP-dependent enzyme [Terriglobales bacterium]|nr:aminotransferase class V-fold PLP-dependent enzyme [Terriglobales bacterium]